MSRRICSTAWRCRFLIARRSQHGRVIVEVHATLVDFHTGRNVRQVDPEASTYADDKRRHAEIGPRTIEILFPRQRALTLRPETGPLPRRSAPCDRREAPLHRGLGPVGVAQGGLATCSSLPAPVRIVRPPSIYPASHAPLRCARTSGEIDAVEARTSGRRRRRRRRDERKFR